MAFQCRICGNETCLPIISLGSTPLANSLLRADQLSQPEPRYPLDLVLCPHCSLVQITETVPPEILFSEYLYFSSFSEAMLVSVRELANRLVDSRTLSDQSLVVEVGSNDGYLLYYYQQRGVPVLGIEPASNVAQVANQRGINTIRAFFDSSLAQQLASEGKYADAIHINNVLAHVADLRSVVTGMGMLLKETGVLVVEVPYVKEMIDKVEFDTIYHEHLCYFSLTALDHLFRQHDLYVQDVELIPLHGGSLRVFIGKRDRRGSNVTEMLKSEEGWGVYRLDYYQDFAQRVENLKDSLRKLLSDIRQQGKRIAAYGAAAKGATLLNCYAVGREYLDYVVDRNFHKHGYFMPGVHLPICDPARLLEDMPDYVVILAWNFAPEILQQQEAYCEKGGHFIIPLPEPIVIGCEHLPSQG